MDAFQHSDDLDLFFRDKLREVHTCKPAVIVAINGNMADVQPLTRQKYFDGEQLGYPVIYDVPLMIYSAARGDARVTVPLAVGDNVIVFFSDRDFGELLETEASQPINSESITPLSLYPIFAIPSFFTFTNQRDFDSENIVIENKSSKISIAPDGNIEMTTQADVNVTCANANVTAETANVTAEVNITGNTNITGTLDVTGAIIASSTVTASDGVFGGKPFLTHTHGGVSPGTSSTAPPT